MFDFQNGTSLLVGSPWRSGDGAKKETAARKLLEAC